MPRRTHRASQFGSSDNETWLVLHIRRDGTLTLLCYEVTLCYGITLHILLFKFCKFCKPFGRSCSPCCKSNFHPFANQPSLQISNFSIKIIEISMYVVVECTRTRRENFILHFRFVFSRRISTLLVLPCIDSRSSLRFVDVPWTKFLFSLVLRPSGNAGTFDLIGFAPCSINTRSSFDDRAVTSYFTGCRCRSRVRAV